MTEDAADAFRTEYGVSRETSDRMSEYVDLLLKWNRSVNLISRRSATEIWDRHIRDSAQLFALAPSEASNWLDMGAGAGLPGMVVAIIAAQQRPELRVTLLESDERKAAFLHSVTRSLGISCDVIAARIESAPRVGADVISARALAPLERLLFYADRHRVSGAICLLPKGRTYAAELTQAKKIWHVDAEAIQSRTNPESVVLRIKDFSRV